MTKPQFEELFEQPLEYPDIEVRDRLSRLIGLDTEIEMLTKILGLLVNPKGFTEWINKYHKGASTIEDMVLRRPPLIILAGDVGSGKTELASTVGDAVARQQNIPVTLFPLSLAARGQGRVGEMTQLISTAFEYTISRAKKLKSDEGAAIGAIILLVDEADALAQSRENNQMHHEDKAGVNAFIRGIDSLGNGKLPAAVIMCTNRPDSLDPAIRRRAADILYFNRPSESQRHEVLDKPLSELGFNQEEINQIVKLTGPNAKRKYGFTFSDLVHRLIPAIILKAYPTQRISPSESIETVLNIEPTPVFKEEKI